MLSVVFPAPLEGSHDIARNVVLETGAELSDDVSSATASVEASDPGSAVETDPLRQYHHLRRLLLLLLLWEDDDWVLLRLVCYEQYYFMQVYGPDLSVPVRVSMHAYAAVILRILWQLVRTQVAWISA